MDDCLFYLFVFLEQYSRSWQPSRSCCRRPGSWEKSGRPEILTNTKCKRLRELIFGSKTKININYNVLPLKSHLEPFELKLKQDESFTVVSTRLTKCIEIMHLYHGCKNLLVYYCKCCNLIGYATRYLFVHRYIIK